VYIVAILLSVVAALGGLTVAATYYWPRFQRFSAAAFNQRFGLAYAWAHNKGYFDEVYEAMAVRGLLLNAGRATQWFDKYIVDGFVDGLGEAYYLLSDRLRRLQTGKVQTYAVGLFAGVLILAVLFLIFLSGGPLASAAGGGR
jgi:NADH-quinone oxidoreductase subunit L